MNNRQRLVCLALAALAAFPAMEAQVRTHQLLERGWKFSRDDRSEFSAADFNDAKWQSVTIPHDWAIYGPFSIHNDMQNVAIAQDGQTEAMEQAGRTGGLPFVGTGWYRLRFEAPSFREGRTATLVFDGAMSHARVYVNGHEVGYWPYGYNSFYVDATPYLCEGQENELAVRLENEPESSRWYPGAGLYRNVHLVVNEAAHIPTWGTYLTTPVVSERIAKVVLKTQLVVPQGADTSRYRIVTLIKNDRGEVVAKAENPLSVFADEPLFEQEFAVENPALWSPDTPILYKAESTVYDGTEVCDEYTTRFGIRSLAFVPGEGFFLNGQKTKFRGVCNHHDLGPLGAAINEAALRRQVRMLKDMGCNAIRTSHNMPAPELVTLCDEMGMMLMCETFDEWVTPKMANGYHKVFDEWADRDITNLVHQFRNNPSVVMWCIGNEVPDQWDHDLGEGHAAKLARRLQDIFHREDPTRPVTQGMDQWQSAVYNGVAATMDIPGFNYRSHRYAENHAHLPQDLILGSETASTVSSRGVYRFPVERVAMRKYDDHQSSSYDLEYCDWSNLPEDDWLWHDDYDWAIGEFVWTGFDYLGEPTPYYTDWPSHSSLFGIIDLAGLPKDRYYLYRSHWNKEAETLHVLPHWTWPGREGETTPIFVYTNYPSAEVFINGVSQGRRTKDLTVTAENSADSLSLAQLKRQSRYRLMWMDTKYEPGTVRVVAYDADGHAVAETEMQTAGEPDHIELTADRTELTADGRDLAFVTVKVVDKEGRLCPDAQHLVKFGVKGKGVYRAGANGDPVSLEQFHLPQMHVFNGMMTAIVQTTDEAGTLTLTASAKGLKKGSIELQSK